MHDSNNEQICSMYKEYLIDVFKCIQWLEFNSYIKKNMYCTNQNCTLMK